MESQVLRMNKTTGKFLNVEFFLFRIYYRFPYMLEVTLTFCFIIDSFELWQVRTITTNKFLNLSCSLK